MMETTQELRLPAVPLPSEAHSGPQIMMFGSSRPAVDHLLDHLLTAPECIAWAAVMPRLRHHVDVDSPDARYDLARRIQYCPAEAQGLLDDLASLLREELVEAKGLGWFKRWSCSDLRQSESDVWAQATRLSTQNRPVTVAFSTSGVLMVFELVMCTVFIPGQGDPGAVIGSRDVDRSHNPLRRERGMRCQSSKADRPRCPSMSALERVYFGVFRPAVQFLRSLQHLTLDFNGRPVRTDYALIKDVLPSQSRLKYEDWRNLRQPRKAGVS